MLAQMAPIPAGCNVIPAPALRGAGTEDPVNPAGGAQSSMTQLACRPRSRRTPAPIQIDWNISDKDHIFFRYNINDSLTNYTYGLNQGQVSPQALRTQLGKIEETHTFTPTLLNQFSIGDNRFYSDTNSTPNTRAVRRWLVSTVLRQSRLATWTEHLQPDHSVQRFRGVRQRHQDARGTTRFKFGTQIRATTN